MSDIEDLIKSLEEKKKNLLQQYAATSSQQTTTLNDADQPKLQVRLDKLEQEVQKIEEKIRKLRAVSGEDHHSRRNYSQVWEDKLPQLNFKKSKKIVQDIFTTYFESQKEEQALFLLQRSHTMRGDLCIKHIKALLQEMGDWYPPFEYSFLRHQLPNTVEFLKALAYRFQIETGADSTHQYTTQVLDKLCSSLTGGNVFLLFVELTFEEQNDFLEWFVNSFWHELVSRISIRRDDHPFIKVVGVIAVRNVIPKPTLSSGLCCTKQQFNGKKVLELPLQKWSNQEIYEWLWKHSKLSGMGYEQSQMQQMAKAIYQDSDQGEPCKAYDQLMEALNQSVSEQRVS